MSGIIRSNSERIRYCSAILFRKIPGLRRRPGGCLHLTGIAFGDSFVLASLPSEPFTEIGLAVRKDIFAGKCCMITALANGTGTYTNESGYIPNAWNYGRGGCEDAPRSNPYSRTTASRILCKYRELAASLEP